MHSPFTIGWVILCSVWKASVCEDSRLTSFHKDTDIQPCSDIFVSIDARSKLECSVLCSQRHTCRSFRYNTDTKTCYHSDGTLCNTEDTYYVRGAEQEPVESTTPKEIPTTAEETTTAVATTPTTTVELCSNGLTYGGLDLQYSDGKKKNYAEAQGICTDLGRHLFTIPDPSTLNYFSTCTGWDDPVWIDGKEGKDHMQNNLPYSKWDGGNTPGATECPMLHRSAGVMKGGNCDQKLNYICQL